MKRRPGLFLLPLLGFVLGLSLSRPVDAAVRVYVNVAPPPLIVETRPPAPGPLYVWVGGYHRWDGRAYVWVPGRWVVPPRRHGRWVPGHWVRHRRGWFWVEGHWR
jgi:hypothetical protein